MIPSPLVGVVLALAAYRLTRLVGWDDWPPIVKARAWVIGEHWVPDISTLIAHGERHELQPSIEGDVVKIPATGNFAISGGDVSLPGKTPDSEAEGVRPAYRRPTLAHLVHCPWCLGWWVSLAVYLLWLFLPEAWVLYPAGPLALSSTIGFMARNLDP